MPAAQEPGVMNGTLQVPALTTPQSAAQPGVAGGTANTVRLTANANRSQAPNYRFQSSAAASRSDVYRQAGPLVRQQAQSLESAQPAYRVRPQARALQRNESLYEQRADRQRQSLAKADDNKTKAGELNREGTGRPPLPPDSRYGSPYRRNLLESRCWRCPFAAV